LFAVFQQLATGTKSLTKIKKQQKIERKNGNRKPLCRLQMVAVIYVSIHISIFV